MSIRSLPEAPSARLPNVSFELMPQALAAWDGSLRPSAAAQGDATISILDPIGADMLGDGVTAKRISAALRSIGEKPVTVVINSPGGDFFEGLAIYNLLRMHPKAVTVQILGIAASAASVIAMCGDDIQIAKAAMLMVHNSQWVAIGDRHVMTETATAMETFDKAMRGVYVDRTGQSDAAIGAMMDATTFISADQAVAKGFADELLDPDQVASDAKAALDQRPLAYRIEAALAAHGVPRAERRRLIKDFVEAKPGAGGDDDGKPGAADCAEGLAHLRAAAMSLNLAG